MQLSALKVQINFETKFLQIIKLLTPDHARKKTKMMLINITSVFHQHWQLPLSISKAEVGQNLL